MVDKRDTYSSGADKEDFDMPSGYEGLHGMVECPNCGAFSQYKPNINQNRCNNCSTLLE